MNKKPQDFTNIQEQISILKSRGLIITNEKAAKNLLCTYGYYDIINGYKEPYVTKDNDEETYIEGTTFRQVFSLFEFDHLIRNMMMLSMIDIEEHMRCITSYVIGEAFTSNHSQYLNPLNYNDRKNQNSKFTRAKILGAMQNALSSDKDPIKYNMDTYGNVPPWVLFKGIYMSTLYNFIKLQKPAQKEKIITQAYGIDEDLAKSDEIKGLFTESLILFLEYRNLCAHGGRIFNYVPKNTITITPKLISDLSKFSKSAQHLKSSYGLERMLILLDLFKYKGPYANLEKIICSCLTTHIQNYPKDYKYLIKSTGMSPSILYFILPDGKKIQFSKCINLNGDLDLNYLKEVGEVAATKE